jgi:hypothetical protein
MVGAHSTQNDPTSDGFWIRGNIDHAVCDETIDFVLSNERVQAGIEGCELKGLRDLVGRHDLVRVVGGRNRGVETEQLLNIARFRRSPSDTIACVACARDGCAAVGLSRHPPIFTSSWAPGEAASQSQDAGPVLSPMVRTDSRCTGTRVPVTSAGHDARWSSANPARGTQ